MSSEQFAVRLEHPASEEPLGLPEPTEDQWSLGMVVVMLETMCGNATHKKNEIYLMDVPAGERLIAAGYARRETQREIDIAKFVGHRRSTNLASKPQSEQAEKPAKKKKKAKSGSS